jgi:hypothetical protein
VIKNVTMQTLTIRHRIRMIPANSFPAGVFCHAITFIPKTMLSQECIRAMVQFPAA